MAKVKTEPPRRTCFDCDHIHACQAWAGASQLLHTDATHCANYQTMDDLHRRLLVAQEIIDGQNVAIEILEQAVAESRER